MTEQQKQGERQYKGSFVISDETATLSGNQITYTLQNQETFTEIDLSQYCFTQTIYNVALAYGNASLIVRVNLGATQTITFPDGFYTADQLLTLLCNELNTLSGGTHFTYVLTGYKFTISITATRTLRFVRGSTPQSNNIYDMLGLVPTQSVFLSDIQTTLAGQNYVNFTNTLMLQVSCQQLLPKWNINTSNYIYFIPLSAGFGYTQTGGQQLDEDNAYMYYEGQQTSLRQLTFSLFDQNNRPITVPSNWSYAFKFDAYI